MSTPSSSNVVLFCAGAISGAALYAAYERYRQQAALNSIAPINPQIPSNIRYPSQGITDMIIKYQENLYRQDPKRGEPGNSSYSIRCRLPPDAIRNALPITCPDTPESYASIFKDCQDIVFPGLTHWAAPDFMAYFKIHASEPSVLADYLISSLNVVGFSWVSSPVATELEQVVLDWVARLLGLPDCFLSTSIGGGVIQAFASESALCGMIAGREAALQGYEGAAKSERASRLVVYVSDQTHAIGHKGCMVLGMPHMRVIPTRRSSVDPDNYGMDPKDLHAAILEDVAKGLVPCYVILTVGTTSTTAIDPIQDTVRVLRGGPASSSIWIHVDGAYGGAAVICPEYRHWFDGIEGCDSICVNAHKWMLTGVCCSLMWVRDRRPLIQALALHPEYLKNDFMSAVQYKDWHIGLGRRFNALKLWFVLRRFGAEGMRKHIRQTIENAHRLERGLLADGRFKRFVPVRAGLVCFHLTFGDEALIETLLRTVNESGSLFLIHSKVDGVYFLRLTPGGLEVNGWHMDNAVRALATTLTTLVQGNPTWQQAYNEWKQGTGDNLVTN